MDSFSLFDVAVPFIILDIFATEEFAFWLLYTE